MDTLTLKERYFFAIHSMREALKYYVPENGNDYSDSPEYYANEFDIYPDKKERPSKMLELNCTYAHYVEGKGVESVQIQLLYTVADDEGNEELMYYGFYNGREEIEDDCEPIHAKAIILADEELMNIIKGIDNPAN